MRRELDLLGLPGGKGLDMGQVLAEWVASGFAILMVVSFMAAVVMAFRFSFVSGFLTSAVIVFAVATLSGRWREALVTILVVPVGVSLALMFRSLFTRRPR
jgi:hypothetical protein